MEWLRDFMEHKRKITSKVHSFNRETNFFDTGQKHRYPSNEDLTDLNIVKFTDNDASVEILRASLFFYAEQKLTLGELRVYFTNKAIAKLESDGYIKIIRI